MSSLATKIVLEEAILGIEKEIQFIIDNPEVEEYGAKEERIVGLEIAIKVCKELM